MSPQQFQAPRGTSDILPNAQPLRRLAQQRCEELAMRFGYDRIEVPTFEHANLFIRGVGEVTDIVEKETYTFKDRGGDLITLRPEGTAGVCRAYLEHGMHNLPQPVRLYYYMPMYRYERPQAGRFREFWQFGVEAFGDADSAIDAEVIDLAWSTLREFGVTDVSLLLNSIGDKESRPNYLEALREYFTPHLKMLSPDDQRRLETNTLRILDSKDDAIQPLLADAPKSIDYLSSESKTHWESLLTHLDSLGISYEVTHNLVRGFDYYTHTVFEFVPSSNRRQSTILAGGRYNGLIEELGGKSTPGIGFAMGIERLIEESANRGGIEPPPQPKKVLIAHLGAGKETALKLTADLRRAGVPAILGPSRGLKSQLRYAGSIEATHAVIIGEEEIAKGKVVIRDLEKSEQLETPFENVLSLLN